MYQVNTISMSIPTSRNGPNDSASFPSIEWQVILEVVDAINRRFGKNMVATGSVGQGDNWQPKADHLSPHYLSRWSDLPTATARLILHKPA